MDKQAAHATTGQPDRPCAPPTGPRPEPTRSCETSRPNNDGRVFIARPDRARSSTSGRRDPKRRCRVCGFWVDRLAKCARVECCQACKSFFVRTLEKLEKLGRKKCVTQKQTCLQKGSTRSCRICRFKRCVQLGMWKPTMEEPANNRLLSRIFLRCYVCGSMERTERRRTCTLCLSCAKFVYTNKDQIGKAQCQRRKFGRCYIRAYRSKNCPACRLNKFSEIVEWAETQAVTLTPDIHLQAFESSIRTEKCFICGDPEGLRGSADTLLSCKSCRLFFRQHCADPKSTGECVAGTNDCEITLTTREMCKYCRYKKCKTKHMAPPEKPKEKPVGPPKVSVIVAPAAAAAQPVPGSSGLNNPTTSAAQLCLVCGSDKKVNKTLGARSCRACRKFYSKNQPTGDCIAKTSSCLITVGKLDCSYCRAKKCERVGLQRKKKSADVATNQQPVSASSGSAPKESNLTMPRVCIVCNSTEAVKLKLARMAEKPFCEECRLSYCFYARFKDKRARLRCSAGSYDCPIDCSLSSICAYCRYKKCLDVGLPNPEETGAQVPAQPGTTSDPHQSTATTNQAEPPQASTSHSTGQQAECRVCGSTKNVVKIRGVKGCAACNVFFNSNAKRTDLRCSMGDQRCIINAFTRNNCASCRLKRCREVGMTHGSEVGATQASEVGATQASETLPGVSNRDCDHSKNDESPRTVTNWAQAQSREALRECLKRPRECDVCNSTTSVYNGYDIAICASCRSFYKALYNQEKRLEDFSCSEGQRNCVVDYRIKPTCRYCRAKRFIQLGAKIHPKMKIPNDFYAASDDAESAANESSTPQASRRRLSIEVEAMDCRVCGSTQDVGQYYNAIICYDCKTFAENISRVDCVTKLKNCVINTETRSNCGYCRMVKLFIAAGISGDDLERVANYLEESSRANNETEEPNADTTRPNNELTLSLIDQQSSTGQRSCSVCGSDYDVGIRYNATCCSACKQFFVIHQNSTFECSAGHKNCPIDFNTRNICRYCRLAKCRSVGMTRNTLANVSNIELNSNQGASSDARTEIQIASDENDRSILREDNQLPSDSSLDQVVSQEWIDSSIRSLEERRNCACTVCGSKTAVKKCYDKPICISCRLFYSNYHKLVSWAGNLQCQTSQASCTIDVATKRGPLCPYCRFKKCLDVGLRTRPEMKIPESFYSRSSVTAVCQTTTLPTSELDVSQDNQSCPPMQTEIELDRPRCLICGDTKDVGDHYNTTCCGPCLQFFYKNAEQSFECVTGDKRCPMNVITRANCRHCRLARCRELGMSRGYDLTQNNDEESQEEVDEDDYVRDPDYNSIHGSVTDDEEIDSMDDSASQESLAQPEATPSAKSRPSSTGFTEDAECAVCSGGPAKPTNGTILCFSCRQFHRWVKENVVDKGLSYACRKGNYSCNIDRRRKKSSSICKCCRWRKCLQVGLKGAPLPAAPQNNAATRVTTSTTQAEMVRESTAMHDARCAGGSKQKSATTTSTAEPFRSDSFSPITSDESSDGQSLLMKPSQTRVIQPDATPMAGSSKVLNRSDVHGKSSHNASHEDHSSLRDFIDHFSEKFYDDHKPFRPGSRRRLDIPDDQLAKLVPKETEAHSNNDRNRQPPQQQHLQPRRVSTRLTPKVGRVGLDLKLFTQLDRQEQEETPREFEAFETITTYSYVLDLKTRSTSRDQQTDTNGPTLEVSVTTDAPTPPDIASSGADVPSTLTIKLKAVRTIIDRRPLMKKARATATAERARGPAETESLIGPGEDCDESDHELVEIDCDA